MDQYWQGVGRTTQKVKMGHNMQIRWTELPLQKKNGPFDQDS